MAWRSSGATNSELIGNLFRNGLVTSTRVRDAMLKVDRANYCPDRLRAYLDSPQQIGHGATISAPHMHALAAEALISALPLPIPPSSYSPSSLSSPSLPASSSQPRPRILDIGSGSGYLTHVLAELIPDDGIVLGVEHIGALRDLGEGNMRGSQRGRELLESGKVRFVVGDGRRGWKEAEGSDGERGWDVIHVGAAASTIHEDLITQLRRPGRLFVPVRDPSGERQHIWIVNKDEKGRVVKEKTYGVSYVLLTDAPVSSAGPSEE